MSHIVTIKTQLKDPKAIEAACHRMNLAAPVIAKQTFALGDREGITVKLHNWLHPIIIDQKTGDVHYDNYEGRWGDIKYLHKFLQTYAVEKAKIEAWRKGYTAREEHLEDGSIKVHINVPG